jgi:hypothetical protein
MFRRVRKTAKNDNSSSCLSDCPHVKTRLPLERFSWSFFRKSVEKIQVSLQPDKSNGYLTWRQTYFYNNISRWILLRMLNISDKRCLSPRLFSFKLHKQYTNCNKSRSQFPHKAVHMLLYSWSTSWWPNTPEHAAVLKYLLCWTRVYCDFTVQNTAQLNHLKSPPGCRMRTLASHVQTHGYNRGTKPHTCVFFYFSTDHQECRKKIMTPKQKTLQNESLLASNNGTKWVINT